MLPTTPARKAHGLALDERGFSLVAVGLWMLVVLGLGAFSLDVTRLYTEYSELRNAADAAALAIASECSIGACDLFFDEHNVADTYADANARDRAMRVEDVSLDRFNQTVTVKTASEDSSGGNHLDVVLAQVLGFEGVTVSTDASATWGSPGAATTLPLALSKCVWDAHGATGFADEVLGGSLHRASAVTDNLVPPALRYPHRDAAVTIYLNGSSSCRGGASGHLPGGFGWLAGDGGRCQVSTAVQQWVDVEPGSSPTADCAPEDFEDIVGSVVTIPYFKDLRSSGSNAQYQIHGYGALYVTGYNFNGQNQQSSLIDNQDPCGGNHPCIQGYLIGDWTVSGTTKGGPYLGINSVQLAG